LTLLTIAIPTFNREPDLRRLLECLDGQIPEDVVVQVSDNASEDGTPELLREWAATRPWLRVHRQPENIGPFRNVVWLVEESPDSDYIWIFGDDDVVVPGTVEGVIDALRAERPAWLFLPHHWVDRNGNVVPGSPAPGALERYANAHDLYLAYGHWLTFITASIVNREGLRRSVREIDVENAYRPLLWYFHASLDGPCLVAPEHVVLGSQAISWEDKVHIYLTEHFTSLWEHGLNARLTQEEFGSTLDALYDDVGTSHKWRRVPLDRFAAIVSRFPQSEALRSYLFGTAREQGWRDALPVLEDAARAVGDDVRARRLVEEGEGFFEDGDLEGAAGRFAQATRIAPAMGEAWNNLAVALHQMGRLHEAIAAVDAAVFAAPDDTDALANQAAIAGVAG
jgi:glycosyltransferase involved in cell wall biosynthesis